MALVACGECGNQVSDKAPTCPKCGAPVASPVPKVQVVPPAKKSSGCGTLIAGAFLLLCLLALLGQCSDDRNAGSSSPAAIVTPQTAVELTPTQVWSEILRDWDADAEPSASHVEISGRITAFIEAYPEAAELGQAKSLLPDAQKKASAYEENLLLLISQNKWNYNISEDKMTGKPTFFATLASENQIELDFPYGEPQHGRLSIRDKPGSSFDVIFSIERGQLLCNSWDGCSALVRIDDAAPRKWAAMPASDQSTETLFFSNNRALFAALKKAKVVRIQPEIYQAGVQVFEFDVSGFRPDKFQHKK